MKENTLVKETGLKFEPSFFSDKLFYLSLIAAPIVMAIMTWLSPAWGRDTYISKSFGFSVVLWQPFIEELLFRGVIQGQLSNRHWARRQIAGFSVANFLTTLLFMLAHLANHSLWWAAVVVVPSLVFGYFRDRHNQIYPSILLHAAYNACYFLIGARFAGDLLPLF